MAFVKNSIMFSSGGGSDITVVANYSALPDPTTVSGQFYWCESSQGTSWLPGSLGGTYYNSGMYYSNGVSWSFLNVPYQATQTEVNTGTNTDKFVTPNTFANAIKWNEKVNASRFIYQGKTSITGVTGETNVCSFKISGGAYSNTDAFKFDFTPTKSVTAATSTFRIYIGTTSGARTNQIASTALGTTGRSSDNTRRYFIDAGSLDCSVGFTTNANSGLGAQTSVNTPISVNMDNDLWITITANPTATGEVHGLMGASITPLK
jgi:hypothetical protein